MLATPLRSLQALTPALPYFTASTTRSLASLARDHQYTEHAARNADLTLLHQQLVQQQRSYAPPRSALRIRRATQADYSNISTLISANRGLDLTPKERSQKGFVQGSWQPEILQQLSTSGPGFWIAEVGDSQTSSGEWRLAGAALATAPGAVATGPAGETNHVAEKHFGKQGYYLYGPVVVDSAFRGHGVLRKLSDAVFDGTKESYSTAVAFIEDVNHVSRVVHERLGWKAVDGFQVGGSKYNVFSHPTA